MMEMPLYFSLRDTAYTDSAGILLSDICAISDACTEPLAGMRIPASGLVTRVSALWVAQTLCALYPGRVPLSVGAPECCIFLREKQHSRLVTALKAALLAIVMFFGGAVAIMTFHEDVNMSAVLSDIYAFFTGEQTASVPVVSIPYSVGIVAGFVVLLGLVHRKRHKPTLLELSVHAQEKALRDYQDEKDANG